MSSVAILASAPKRSPSFIAAMTFAPEDVLPHFFDIVEDSTAGHSKGL
jgi:hypothetical protein